MSLKHKPLDQITGADIAGLINDAVPEGRDIEYKRTLPGTTDADKREFLSDLSSFANVSGGLMIFGVEENEGRATAVVDLSGEDLDAQILRLEALARDSLDPRIPGLGLRVIEGEGGSVEVEASAP